MTETKTSRSAHLAGQFEAAQESFIRLVESLSDEQWRMTGANTPELQVSNEDESRQVRVIAHHVAVTQDWIMNRIKAILEDRPTPPVDFKVINSEHAVEHADASKAEVVALLRGSLRRIAKDIRAIPDEKLDIAREVPSGKMSVQERIERVLIGHMKSHQGSIEATIS